MMRVELLVLVFGLLCGAYGCLYTPFLPSDQFLRCTLHVRKGPPTF